MSYNINTSTLSGIVSSDPKNNATAGQKARVSLGLFINRGEESKHVFITFWDKTGEYIIEHVKKGDFVVVQAYLDTYKKDENSPELLQLIGTQIDPSPYKKQS